MTPENRAEAGQRLIKGDVISAILFDDDRAKIISLVCGNYGIPIPIRHIRRPNLIAIHTVAHSIATDAIPARSFGYLDDTSVLSSRFSPLMIKRPCVTTVFARTIGSTREHCVHNAMWKPISRYIPIHIGRYATFFAFDQAIRVPLDLMTHREGVGRFSRFLQLTRVAVFLRSFAPKCRTRIINISRINMHSNLTD